MNSNETVLTNATIASGPGGPTMANLIDPDANPVFGFWVNGVAMTLIGIIGIFGNCSSIRVLSHKQMRSSVNYILIALASSDLVLIATSILLFGLTTVFPYNTLLKDYFFIIQPQIVKVVFPLAMIAQTISIYMTFLISFERYIAVCHPLKAKSFCTKARTKATIIAIVVLSVLYNIPKYFEISVGENVDGEFGTFYYASASDLRRDKLYITIYIHWLYCIFMNLIPLSGITFFNLMIYQQVRIVNRNRAKLTSKEMQEIKLTTMLFCVVIVFLTCQFLAVLANILETFKGIHNDVLTKLSIFFVTLNSSVNFIIYVVLVRKFRVIFIRQLKAFFCCEVIDFKTRKFTKQTTISSSDSDQVTNDTLLSQ